MQLQITELVLAQLLGITFLHFLLHGPAGDVIRVYFNYVQGGLGQIVKRAHKLIVDQCIVNARVANAATSVWLNHPIHF